MRTILIFSLCAVLGVFSIFAQSNPVVITPITNGFTVSFTLPAYTLRDTTLTDFFATNEIFKYVKLDDFGIIDDVGYPTVTAILVRFEKISLKMFESIKIFLYFCTIVKT